MTATSPRGTTAGLSVRIEEARVGTAVLLRDVELAVGPGRTTAVVGPSGAGKTSLLRVVAGLLPGGAVAVAGTDVSDRPPHERPLAVVFQEPRLLPHLDVVDNVAFPLRMAGLGRRERRRRAHGLLERVGLTGQADQRPSSLSGGEQQRANLARALAADPDVLLLDEPLAAVDPDARAGLRELIRELTAATTTLHVTHDRAEAAELGDRVAVVLAGRLVQDAPPREVFTRPATAEVAALVGCDVLTGHVRDGVLDLGSGCVPLPDAPDGPCAVAVRPEQVELGAGPLCGRVGDARYQGDRVRVRLDLAGQVLHAEVPVGEDPPLGADVAVRLPAPWRLPR